MAVMENNPPVVVVIDDDVDFLELTGSILEQAGFRAAVFSTPEKALSRLPELNPRLVITDLMMGRLDAGFALSRALKENEQLRHIPVIVVTAVASRRGFDFKPQSPDDLAAMRVEGFLEKPLNPKTFIAKVKEVLAAYEARGC